MPPSELIAIEKRCSLAGCQDGSRAKGYCNRHYDQLRRGRALVLERPSYMTETPQYLLICTFEGCVNVREVRGLCAGHIDQLRRGKELSPIKRLRQKLCTVCQDPNKPRTIEFFRFKKSAGRLDGECLDCQRKKWRSPKRKAQLRNARLLRKYGVGSDWFRTQLVLQEGKCAICGTHDPGQSGAFAVDHDHESGAPRGLLCLFCNTGLGHFKDSKALLSKASAYLERHGR